MAAPVATLRLAHNFRDAKGNTASMRLLYGDATNAAILTDLDTMNGHLQAMSNAHVTEVTRGGRDRAYGANAEFPNVEDGAVLTFRDSRGGLHRYKVAAPKLASFKADGETVDQTETNTAAVITDFQTFIYGFDTDTAPLVYVGGIRVRRRTHRKFNIFTKAPDLAGPGE